MPSTTSSTVSADFDSSTVMTPSLPTFSIASAIRLPIVLSLLLAMVATWAISFLSLVDLLSFFSSSVTAATAASMPRLSPIGLAPAVTLRSPSRKIACASTVAVVVPSPAMSEVFEATSFSIWAPMSSYGSFSSISLATVTPSLVIVGLPNFLSMTTLRPLGPSVAVTAAAIMLMPLSRLDRASSSNFSCFGIARVPPYSRMARTSSSRMIRYSLSSSFTSEPEYFPKRILSPALTSRGTFLPSSVTLPLPTATTLPSWGFSLAVSGMMIPPFLTSFSSSRSTRRRSCNGRIFIGRVPPSDFGIRRAPFIMALDAPKRLPIDSDEHDGLIPCGSVHPDGRCHGFRVRFLPHAARHYGLMPRRPIHPGRRSHRSRTRIDTLPYAAGRLPLTPARRCLAVAFFEAILRECLDDLLRCRDPSVLLFDPRHHASLAKLIEARHLSHRVLPLLVRKRDPGSDTALPRVKR